MSNFPCIRISQTDEWWNKELCLRLPTYWCCTEQSPLLGGFDTISNGLYCHACPAGDNSGVDNTQLRLECRMRQRYRRTPLACMVSRGLRTTLLR
jgi:hypothetical protein